MSVVYNGTYYYYVTDLQGDVVAIVDTAGVKVVEYLYDAWGRLLETSGTKATDLGLHNPLRYRGYVYDTESGLYYLQSRYYNPTLGRFLSSDVIYDTDAGLQGFNLFLYCGNNPTNRIDASGKDSKDLIDGDKEDDNYHDHSGGHGKPSGGNEGRGIKTSSFQSFSGEKIEPDGCVVVGGGHGNLVHSGRIEQAMGEMANSGNYSEIYGNRAMDTAGLNGSWRPDISAKGTNGEWRIIEFASPSQRCGTFGYRMLENKVRLMKEMNPNVKYFDIVPW